MSRANTKEVNAPLVSLLMCTYNGARFIDQQLSSLERQSYTNWTLVVSDDGSHDNTLEIVRAFAERSGSDRVKIIEGPRQGFASNFLSLTAREDIRADFYAWSDQDDIWHEDKLQTALNWIATIPSETPALYCARSELIGDTGTAEGFSPLFSRPPHFSNALVQSIAGGNTMVFNQAARDLLRDAGGSVDVPSHDWWAYLLISGAGGIIHYDQQPKLLYRQHNQNLIGSNATWCARLKRLHMVFKGSFHDWNSRNICALETMGDRLTQEHQVRLAHFKAAQHRNLLSRIQSFRRAGLYRQTRSQNLALLLAVLFKKI
ncbi:glycosyltransferase family 2 protein [Pseudomonas caspiana]